MLHRMLSSFIAALLCAPAAHAQYIGIFMDTEAASCAGMVGQAPWVDLHVIAILEGEATELHGASFRVVGVPSSWTASNALWVPEPITAASLGHPLFSHAGAPNAGAVDVVFSQCQRTSRVLLGRIVLLGAPTMGEVHLQVTGYDLVRPGLNCPQFVLCNEPVFDIQCVGGGEIVLNGPARPSCQLAVEPQTWSGVKSLYQD